MARKPPQVGKGYTDYPPKKPASPNDRGGGQGANGAPMVAPPMHRIQALPPHVATGPAPYSAAADKPIAHRNTSGAGQVTERIAELPEVDRHYKKMKKP